MGNATPCVQPFSVVPCSMGKENDQPPESLAVIGVDGPLGHILRGSITEGLLRRMGNFPFLAKGFCAASGADVFS